MRFYVTRDGLRMSPGLFAVIAAFIGAVLAITMLPLEAFAEEDPVFPDPGGLPKAHQVEPTVGSADSDGDGTADRPDVVSAAATARVLKKPVEDLSQRTETDQVLVNRDGTMTRQAYSSAVRIERDGGWVDVDYDLEIQVGGSYAPKASPVDVEVGGGGTNKAATVDFEDGSEVALTWPEKLPEPTIKGGTATYKISSSTDLLVSATSTGLATRIRLNSEPAGDDPSFTMGLETKKIAVGQDGDSELEFSKGTGGDKETTESKLVAWDAEKDAGGDPVEVVPVDATLELTSVDGSTKEHDLELSTPTGYLSDADTEYPVIIDPDISAVNLERDTWVRSGTSSSNASDYRLLVGRNSDSSSTNPAYSFLEWDETAFDGRKIVKADVHLFQYHAESCSPKTMNIHPLEDHWQAGATWSNKPDSMTNTGTSTSLTENIGRSGCTEPNAYISSSIQKMAQKWADGPANGGFANEGIQLSVPSGNGSDLSYGRRFCSSNPDTSASSCNTASRVPYLSLTYNGPPNTAGLPSLNHSRTYNNTLYVSDTKPTISTSATDPEASRMTYESEIRSDASSGTVVTSCTSPQVGSGSSASCAVPSALTDGSSYVVRSRAVDEHGATGAWSDWVAFTVDSTAPADVSISCTDYTNDTWFDTRPAANTTCTFTSAGSIDFEWKRSAGSVSNDQPALPSSSGSATTPNIAIPDAGYTKIEARAINKAGLGSAWKSFTFGTGPSTLTEPVKDDRSASTFPIKAAAAPDATDAKIQWRYAPANEADTGGWTDATKLKVASSGDTWTGTVSNSADNMSETPRLMWTPSAETGISNPAVVQVRVVFNYAGSIAKASPFQRIQVIPHAFGASFPTEEVGPAEVSLFTGEMQYSETDVSVPGYGGDLSLGRSHLSLSGEPAGPAGIFGPGWTADLSGPDEGVSGFEVIDNTAADGSIILQSPDGVSYVYAHDSGTKGAQKTGTYAGLGETAQEKDTLKLEDVTGESGISHKLTLTELDGTETLFKRTTSGVWTTAQVKGPEDSSTTTYARDADGLVTWIFAPAPDGTTCNTTTQTAGCRALKLTYTTIGSGKRLTQVDLRIWDPKPASDGTPGAGAAMETIPVAKYSYDSGGKLTAAWDPRVGDGTSALKTDYEYASIGTKTVLTQVTEPGLKPWRFGFDSSDAKLDTVKRAHDGAVGGGDATWTIKYDSAVALSGSGLPNLTADATATWGQPAVDAPVGGAAVFGPNRVPAGTPTSDDWQYASLSYFTRSGRTTNAAEYGAGAWQIDSTRYDTKGNTIWDLDAEGRNKALAEGADGAESASIADKYSTITVYNAAETRVEEEYSPMRPVVLDDGTRVTARTLTETDYDNEADGALMPGRPTTGVPDGGFDLAVEERTSVTDRIRPGTDGNTWDTRKVRYRFDPVVTGDGDGWELQAPTRVKEEDGSGWATTLTRFDTEGKEIESRTPEGTETTDGAAADTRSTKAIYYTADTSSGEGACNNKPQWAGMACIVKPGGPPNTGAPIPTETITGYSMLLAPTRVEETADTATRASVRTFDTAGRATKSSISVTGSGASSSAVADTTMAYSGTTGLPTATTRGTETQTTSYDSWGRVTSQTDGAGSTATTTYDAAGRVASAHDGKGTYTYTYDGTDSRGNTERRGLVTKVDVGLPTGTPDEFTGAYDSSGELVEQNYPGGIKATWKRNIDGTDTALTYTQDVGGTQVDLFGYTSEVDNDGRVRDMVGPDSWQTYTYDDRDRLKKVKDTVHGACTTRVYTFTGDSNRTNLKTYGPGSGGGCQEATTSSDVSSSFDTADRITTGGYVHDKLGRATTVAKAHTDQPNGSDLAVGYHANDMVASQTQTVPVDDSSSTIVRKQEFTLDAADRISVIKDYTDTSQLKETLNHYDSDDDSPSWSSIKTRPDSSTAWSTTWSRNVVGLAGDLALIQPETGSAQLQIGNLHGDVVATVDLNTSLMGSYAEYTEYGLARDDTTRPATYGWLGGHQRQSEGIVGGLTLMGARLYNPTTGRFLSMDPVRGGNDNTYTYPADPINMKDLDGDQKKKKKEKKKLHRKKNGKKAGKWHRFKSWWMKQRNGKWGFGMRKGRPSWHSKSHKFRIEYDKWNRWHINRNGKHHKLRNAPRAIGRGLRAAGRWIGRLSGVGAAVTCTLRCSFMRPKSNRGIYKNRGGWA